MEVAGKIVSGQITMSGEALDSAIVHREQTQVQKELDVFRKAEPEAYGTAIKEINVLLNPNQRNVAQDTLGVADKATVGSTDAAMDVLLGDVQKSLGHDIDFANQADREALGNALVNHIRETGGCDLAGYRIWICD
jgi:hypothetical protein